MSIMIDHTSIAVSDFTKALHFYDATLGELGYTRLMIFEDSQTAGYGANNKPAFWISTQGNSEEFIGKARGVHIAFLAPNVETINNWYQRCLKLGGVDNGAPGPRKEYHPGYYGAFIIDPDGWRIEACLHDYKA